MVVPIFGTYQRRAGTRTRTRISGPSWTRTRTRNYLPVPRVRVGSKIDYLCSKFEKFKMTLPAWQRLLAKGNNSCYFQIPMHWLLDRNPLFKFPYVVTVQSQTRPGPGPEFRVQAWTRNRNRTRQKFPDPHVILDFSEQI